MLEVPHAFLLAKAGKDDGGRPGWNFQFVNSSAAALENLGDVADWEPVLLSNAQGLVIEGLCRGREVRFDDEPLTALLIEEGVSDLDEFWTDVLSTGLVARSGDNSGLVLITRDCAPPTCRTDELPRARTTVVVSLDG